MKKLDIILNKAEVTLLGLLAGSGISSKEIKDFQLQGDEPLEELQMYAWDYFSDLHTEKCQEKEHRYNEEFNQDHDEY